MYFISIRDEFIILNEVIINKKHAKLYLVVGKKVNYSERYTFINHIKKKLSSLNWLRQLHSVNNDFYPDDTKNLGFINLTKLHDIEYKKVK